ncbi:hypothetical protein B0H19DRAFT_1155617 [Mycena capillaripes]|nr:hypothetical protein B0H19DRAFT_1155617 [Mycena capillaripes]
MPCIRPSADISALYGLCNIDAMLLAVQLSLVLSSSAMALCLGPGGPGPTFNFTVPRNCVLNGIKNETPPDTQPI